MWECKINFFCTITNYGMMAAHRVWGQGSWCCCHGVAYMEAASRVLRAALQVRGTVQTSWARASVSFFRPRPRNSFTKHKTVIVSMASHHNVLEWPSRQQRNASFRVLAFEISIVSCTLLPKLGRELALSSFYLWEDKVFCGRMMALIKVWQGG